MSTVCQHSPSGGPQIGIVIDLERERVEALARELAPVLRERGAVAVNADDVGDLDRWRRAVRRAGRLLGWRVRTETSADGRRAWANSADFAVGNDAPRGAGEAIEALLFGGDAHATRPRH